MELASLSEGVPSPHFKVSMLALGHPVGMACRAFTTPLQSLTTLLGWHSSKARTTAKSSALKADCRHPGRASQALSPVSVT
eukprot:3386317-Amphidinium_carterae.1